MAFPKLYKRKSGHTNSGGHSNRVATTRHLSRIIMYLIDSGDAQTITQIRDGTGLMETLEDALNWLRSNKIINKILVTNKSFFKNHNTGHLYLINPAWKKLRDN